MSTDDVGSTRILVEPDDPFNRQLVANVHPPEWTNPVPAGRYNLVVVGAGTAGLVTAAVAAGLGAKVALVERHLMGGDCVKGSGSRRSSLVVRISWKRVWAHLPIRPHARFWCCDAPHASVARSAQQR